MRRILLAALLAASSFFAQAAFTLSNTTTDGFLSADPDNYPGNGLVSGDFPAFTLTGTDYGFGGALANFDTYYTDTFAEAATLTFQWHYSTLDVGEGELDPAGYVLNGIKTLLSGSSGESGTTTLSLAAGDNFGWYVHSNDGIGGAGSLSVTASIAAVPEPSTFAMLLGGLGLLSALARRKRA